MTRATSSRLVIQLLAAWALQAAPGLAAAAPPLSERLGADLTPNGAERAGNRDGSIPAWDGGLTTPPAGWKPENGYIDPFEQDKPLFVINRANADKYKEKLSPGLMAMLKKYPNFQMPIYPTRRSFANPQAVYDATKAQAGKVTTKGHSLQNYTAPGTPFPVPATGLEAIYNHQARYHGSYKRCTHWLPVRASGEFYRVGFCEDVVQMQNFDQPPKNLLLTFFGGYDAPPSLVGTIYLVHDPMDYASENRKAWIYNAGQRRVRRAPDFNYDAVTDGDDGMRFSDDYWGFNGATDRFDWKLIGKREMYVPYNTYRVNSKSLKYDDMLDKGHLKSDLMRYELHRVWEVEATVRSGMTHAYSKRVFYIDEDSHMIALADAYDAQGALWRVHVLGLMQAYDAQVMLQAPFVLHDLQRGSYFVEGVTNERKDVTVWNSPRRWSDYQADAVRRRGVR